MSGNGNIQIYIQGKQSPIDVSDGKYAHECPCNEGIPSPMPELDNTKTVESPSPSPAPIVNGAQPRATEPRPHRFSLEELKKKHLAEIECQVEEAKDSASYECYDYSVSTADSRIKLFAARRKGLSHNTSKTPCQDYCLTSCINGCTVLADADGVGSCEHSDIGAKLACEAVVLAVQAATQSCSEEEQLVSRLLSVSFRNRLVSIWIKGVWDAIGNTDALSSAEKLKEFSKYGSTIMYAVMTEHWIVVGNLGDGQILVFNDDYGIKLRVHPPKDSTKVRCLANERCAREDFQVAKYPRDHFNGVLLTSDGIYESLDGGNHYFNYALQAKKRFLGRTPNEPYQAFCYEERGEPYKDFSRMRTQDDCSIVMALDEHDVVPDYKIMMDSIQKHAQAMVFRRWASTCVSYLIQTNNNVLADLVVSKDDNGIELPDLQELAVLDTPIETWVEDNRVFRAYPVGNLPTIEFMQCSGMLRRDRRNPVESEQRILDVCQKIKILQKKLLGLGLTLDSSALFNMSYDEEAKTLHIRREAIRSGENNPPQNADDNLERCFSHLLGVLESENNRIPLFDIGFVDNGIKQSRSGHPEEELAQLQRVNGKTNLKNVSLHAWRFDDGMVLSSGDSRELEKTMNFTLLDSQGNELESYKYLSMELL